MNNSEILTSVKDLEKTLKGLTTSPEEFQAITFEVLNEIILKAEEAKEQHRAFLRRKLAEIDAEI